jgi:hypothetical protein
MARRDSIDHFMSADYRLYFYHFKPSKLEITLGHGGEINRLAGQKLAIGPHFVGSRINSTCGIALFKIIERLLMSPRVFLTETICLSTPIYSREPALTTEAKITGSTNGT